MNIVNAEKAYSEIIENLAMIEKHIPDNVDNVTVSANEMSRVIDRIACVLLGFGNAIDTAKRCAMYEYENVDRTYEVSNLVSGLFMRMFKLEKARNGPSTESFLNRALDYEVRAANCNESLTAAFWSTKVQFEVDPVLVSHFDYYIEEFIRELRKRQLTD